MRSKNWIPVLAAAALATAAQSASAQNEDSIDLRVTRVALFSSGVGFFECDANVQGNVTAELDFRTDQINDILKSLVVRDMGGGHIGVVSYSSQDPIEKTLKSFGVDITGNPTLGKLLDQLRGEPVEVTGVRTLTGVIVGVEKQRVTVENQVIEVEMLNVLTDEGIHQLKLNELQGIRLTNEKVRGELSRALATLAGGHAADKKSVVVHFEGQGERRVRLSYLLEAPIWKTSYRLVLADDRKPYLQGWATVENATEEDWNNVRLSLVSGRPISFRMDLYTPIYIPRPFVELDLYASLRPPEFERGEATAADARLALGRFSANAMAPEAAVGGSAGGRRAGRDRSMEEAKLEADMADQAMDLADSGVASVATATEAGELFVYPIDAPVSLARQHSAMLPIVTEEIDAEKLSIFNPESHPKHPLNGLRFKNSTDLHLMQGPVTVFDDNIYAGDAKLPDIKPDESRLIAYALDLSVEVNTDRTSHPRRLTAVRIAKGTLWQTHKYIDERIYAVSNKDRKDRVVLIEQPRGAGWNLVDTVKPEETTPNLLRFKVNAPAGGDVKLPVKLERVADLTVALLNMGLDSIQFFMRSSVVSESVRKALEKVIAMRTELDRTSSERSQAETDRRDISADQGRIRENLKILKQNSDQYNRQLQKFDEIESKIEQLDQRIVQLRERETTQRETLENYLLSLNVE
jgi:hypothetical protein